MKQTKKNLEMKVYGRHAALSLFKHRPQDIIRAYVTQEGVFEFKQLIRYCVDHKLAYHIVNKEEIDTITKATHHENIALVVKTKKLPTVKELLESKKQGIILALEEVENPHNLGAIMRTAAHFGVQGIIYEAKVPVALTASAHRTAEGGAEVVPAIHIADWNEVFDLSKRLGFKIMATSSHEGHSLYQTQFPDKTIVFLGAEGEGLSTKLKKKIDTMVSIPGTGNVESLNVSNAATALVSEWYRQTLH